MTDQRCLATAMKESLQLLATQLPSIDGAQERQALFRRFEGRLSTDPSISSKMVSYRGNYGVPGFRWMRFKESFSSNFIEHLLAEFQPTSVLDPFSGMGTTPLVAASNGIRAVGIEILPVAALTAKTISLAANDLQVETFVDVAADMLTFLDTKNKTKSNFAFPHLRITEAAFPQDTERALAKAREFLDGIKDPRIQTVLNFACMSVLESVSFTRKDGQYLRWDHRSGKGVTGKLVKDTIRSFHGALAMRVLEMAQDIVALKTHLAGGNPNFIAGSTLEHLRELPSASFDMVISSPPYANRYDYTRTYALELAWLGYDDVAIKSLRQRMLSATVENKSKKEWLQESYGDSVLLRSAFQMYDEQRAIHEVLSQLKMCLEELSNPHIVRMLEGYFLELAVVIAELGRLIRPGGTVVMVNDNVQYHGVALPVDLILSAFAERSGFTCEQILYLPSGKGNSSQQMGRWGRQEQRKSITRWVRVSE